PSDRGSASRSAITCIARTLSPVAMPWTNPGMSSPAGHWAAHGATHSPAWSESRSSSAILRAVRMSSLPVATTMPSATGIPQAGASVRRPWIWTAQRKHDAAGSIPGTWHMVGMRMPSHWAASNTVVPGGTPIRRPSIVKFTIARLYDLDGVVLTCLSAHVATRAELVVHLVLFVRAIRDGAHRAGLCAERAADAIVGHPVPDQRRAPA